MKVFRLRAVSRMGLLLAVVFSLGPATPQTATPSVVKAADAFLGTLDAKQRQRVSLPFDDDEQRRRWSNFPTSFVPRGGISLKEMTPTQRSALMAMLTSVLSPSGL